MEFKDYLKIMFDDAKRMNAETISLTLTDCADFEGWSVHITLTRGADAAEARQ